RFVWYVSTAMTGLIAEGDNALQTTVAWLMPVSGPPIDPQELNDTGGGVVLGRGETAQVRMPLTADTVSRAHCRFTCVNGDWSITDSSKRGTFVNGVRLAPNQSVILREGDT